MEYTFNDIEKKWRQYWAKNETFKAEESSDKPKYYGFNFSESDLYNLSE